MTRPVYSAAEIVRREITHWAQNVLADIAPRTLAVGEVLDPGEAYDLNTLGMMWGEPFRVGERPHDAGVLPDGRGVIFLHYEEVDGALIWRGRTAEEADYFAREFLGRAVTAAGMSNNWGDLVLYLGVRLAEGVDEIAQVYFDGIVEPMAVDENVLRSLYSYRVPFTVAYPVIMVERTPGQGLINATPVVTVTKDW